GGGRVGTVLHQEGLEPGEGDGTGGGGGVGSTGRGVVEGAGGRGGDMRAGGEQGQDGEEEATHLGGHGGFNSRTPVRTSLLGVPASRGALRGDWLLFRRLGSLG